MNRLLVATTLTATATALAVSAAVSRGAPSAPANPTYAEHVAPILFAHCTPCHRPGEVAPFSLTSYDEAKKHADLIALITEKGTMPPWKAVAGYGEFHDENRLSKTQLETLKNWAATGAPRGNAVKEPAAPKFDSEWTLGKPDVVISPPRQYTIAAEGKDDYRNFVIKTDFKEPRYVTAMDVRPGNKKVVHHVIAFLDETDRAAKLEEGNKDGKPGYSTFGGIGVAPSGALGGWAPGLRARESAPGTAFVLKPGTSIVLQIHYHKTGKVETDLTQVGLYFAKETPKSEMNLAWLANPMFRIPAGAKAHKVEGKLRIPVDVTLYGAMPHMHLLGRSMKAWAELPDGKTQPLIWVDDWDFNWQLTYAFKSPIKLPKGSLIRYESVYDNSADNPYQPNDPPKAVTWGEETTDEMFLLIMAYTVDGHPITSARSYNSVIRPFGANFFDGR
jgi:hypothetical protein